MTDRKSKYKPRHTNYSPGPDFSQHDIMGNMDFPNLVADGENPRGFQANTANGTASNVGPGFNYEWELQKPEAPAEGLYGTAEMEFKGIVVKGGKANRTGS